MPSVSEAQKRMMAAAAHNSLFAKKVGIPQEVAKDFNQSDKKESHSTRLYKKKDK